MANVSGARIQSPAARRGTRFVVSSSILVARAHAASEVCTIDDVEVSLMYAETSNANIVGGANATGLPTACDGQELRPGCVVVVHVSLARDLEPGELQRIGDTAVALYTQSGGFQVFYETQVSDRELINISLWNSRSDAERGIQAASSGVRPMLGGLIAAAPVFHFGNVLYAAPPEAF